MLKILVFLSVIFILAFILLFWFLQYENKKEDKKDNLLILILIAIIFSLVITTVIALFLFLIIGSTNVIEILFSLDISTNQVIVIAISFLVYWLTVDNIFEKVFKYFMGENIYAILSLSLTRVASFYIIGIIIKLNEMINLSISAGVATVLLAIDVLYFLKYNKL